MAARLIGQQCCFSFRWAADDGDPMERAGGVQSDTRKAGAPISMSGRIATCGRASHRHRALDPGAVGL